MSPLEISPEQNLQRGNTLLNAATVSITVGERTLDLTWSEFRLLHLLFRQPNQLLPRPALMQSMFAQQSKCPTPGILRVYIHRIRAQLRELESDLTISTRHGIGWILVAPTPKA